MKRKAADLVAYCKAMVGQRYWNGTFGQVASEWLYEYNKGRLPRHYNGSRHNQCQMDIKNHKRVFDCGGLIKGFFWSDNPQSIPEYMSNGFPDINEAGLQKRCSKTGAMDSLPEIPGVLVFSTGHVGVYIGDGYVIEARGFDYGVVKTAVKDRGWLKWGMLNDLEYEQTPKFRLYRLLQYPGYMLCAGSDVKWVQQALIDKGYSVGADGADGDFGKNTKAAVIRFQKARKLAADGIVGKDTITALGGEWVG